MKELSNKQLVELAPAIAAANPFPGVSNRYLFIPTLDVVNLLRDAGWSPIDAEQSLVRLEQREGFQKHLVRFQKSGLAITDQERVDLVLYNSHDRGCAFNLLTSIWRKICANGIMVSNEFFNFSFKHLGFSPANFLDSAHSIAAGAAHIANQVDQMKTIELTPDERGVYAIAAHELIYDDPVNAPIRPVRLLMERRFDDKGNNLWNTFNVVQENIMKGGLKGVRVTDTGRRKRVTTRPVKSIDKNIRLNKALWTLTEKMQTMKIN